MGEIVIDIDLQLGHRRPYFAVGIEGNGIHQRDKSLFQSTFMNQIAVSKSCGQQASIALPL